MSEPLRTCETCRFRLALMADAREYERDSEEASGECHRMPPVLTQLEGRVFREWPDVFLDDWCGEYQPKEGQG